MKRSAFPFLLAAIIALTLSLSFQHDPSLDPDRFVAEFRNAVREAGYDILTATTVPADEVSLPLTILWHPRRWQGTSQDPSVTSLHNDAERYAIARRGGAKVDCFVRYLDGRAQLIDIRANRVDTVDAADLRLALRKQFPGFPVNLEMQ